MQYSNIINPDKLVNGFQGKKVIAHFKLDKNQKSLKFSRAHLQFIQAAIEFSRRVQ